FKFWFSLEEGYLGYTGIGNKEVNFERQGANHPFDKEEINYIKEQLNIKKGELKPVINYKTLTHGQEVIVYFENSLDLNRLGKAKIFVEERDLYAIQDVFSGRYPDD